MFSQIFTPWKWQQNLHNPVAPVAPIKRLSPDQTIHWVSALFLTGSLNSIQGQTRGNPADSQTLLCCHTMSSTGRLLCRKVFLCLRVNSQSGVRLKVMHKQLLILTLHPDNFSLNIPQRWFFSPPMREEHDLYHNLVHCKPSCWCPAQKREKNPRREKQGYIKKKNAHLSPWKGVLCPVCAMMGCFIDLLH